MAVPSSPLVTRPVDRGVLVPYFLGAYGFTWALQLAIPLLGLPYQGATAQVLYVLSILGPLLAAVIVSATYFGKAGLRALFAKALQWRFHPVWYLVAIGTVTGVKALSIVLYRAFGGTEPTRWLIDSPGALLFLLLTQFGYVMFAEEVGWRAFALPRLLDRYGALGGTLMLAVLHASWHLPMFLVPGSNQYGSSFMVYLFTHLAWSLMMSLLYYRSGESALPCLLFHAGLNLPAFFLGMPAGAEEYQRLLYALLILLAAFLLPRPLFRRPMWRPAIRTRSQG